MNIWRVRVTQLEPSGPSSEEKFVLAYDKAQAKEKLVEYYDACGYSADSYKLSHFSRITFSAYDVS